MDLYLPALPALTADLGAVTSVAQLTVTACLIGLAAGQLIAGPLSDRFGRRGILLIGIVAYIATSALCAISPTVELLIAARFVQGLAGGVGIVIAQAAGRDIYTGGALIRFYGRLTVVGGFAAIVGPLLGGLLDLLHRLARTVRLPRRDRRRHPGRHPAGVPRDPSGRHRTRGGFGQTMRDYRTLLSDRVFLGAVLNQGFLYAALFAYLAGSTFVLQDIYGLSPLGYALAFGLNSAGFMTFGYLAGRAAERWSIPGTLAIGILVAGVGALGLLASGLVAMPLWVVIVSLFLLATGVAISSPPATTLALVGLPADRRDRLVAPGHGPLRVRRYRRTPGGRRRSPQHPSPRHRHRPSSVLLAGAAFFLLARPRRTVPDAAASSRPTLISSTN